MEETYRMKRKDLKRYQMVHNVLSQKITQIQAARWLNLTDRQVRRIVLRVREEGPSGVIHGHRDKPSGRAFEPLLRQRALNLVREKYSDFGPTLAAEYLLREPKPIVLNSETLRQWMIAEKIHTPKSRKKKHRSWRPRRECLGELVQLDGSIHDWFEGRGPRCVLVAYIDDATSHILHLEFVPTEDTFHLFQATKHYLLAFGRPITFYVDRDSIYRVNKQASVDEELQDLPPLTQFGRAMEQLDIQLLPAFSPQAKGRVERLFETLQNRLVKAMRLEGISSIPQANRFLQKHFISQHNARFARPPAHSFNAHRTLLKKHNLDTILAFHSPRVIQNDFTIQFKNRFFQIEKKQACRIVPKRTLIVQERLDHSILLRYKHHYLVFHKISKKLHIPWFQKPFKNTPYLPKPGTLAYAQRVKSSVL